MHHWIPFHQLSSSPHAKDKHGWSSSINFAGHDSKHEASSGRTNNARKGVDESVWTVQLVEHVGKKVTEGK
jgi:hypothetical protein